jgi:hypothetical protein
MKRHILAVLAVLPTATLVAQTSPLRVSGFIDTYYAWDDGRPTNIDRAFTTQAARHSEFNINLAHVELLLSQPNVRGRLALQAGTSVQSNYAGEPSNGSVSGASLARHLQEAVVGVRLTDKLWLDGGIMLSHIGSESWISRDNPTYTRSLIAEYSPYYQSGAKLTWSPTDKVTALITVVNGWQNISETNADKSVGARVDWTLSPNLAVGYYMLYGNERPNDAPSESRTFNGATVKWTPSDAVQIVTTADVGSEDGSTWWGGALVGRWVVRPGLALAARWEEYHDRDQVLIATGAGAFRVSGASLGVDRTLREGVQWRTEVKRLSGKDAVFPDRNELSRTNLLLVTSLALSW